MSSLWTPPSSGIVRPAAPSRRSLLRAGALLPLGGLGLAACSSGGDRRHVAIISKGFQLQFWQSVKEGADEVGEEQDVLVTFEGPPTETDVEKQITMLQNAVTREPDAIALAALDSKAAAPMLEEAKAKGIPVIAFDSGVESDIPVATVATDNKAAAREGAEHMADLLEGKGLVGIIAHDQAAQSGKDRRDGFVEGLEEFAPDVEILPVQYGDSDPVKSADIARAMITSNADLTGLIATNEGTAIGLLTGVKESGRDDLVVVGFDSGRAQVDAIRDRVMAGAVTQSPVEMGRATVETALAAIDGKDVETMVDTGFHWFDAENLDDPEIQQSIYL